MVLYALTCYIHEKLCIFLYNGLNSHGCTWIYICIFWKYECFMYFCSTGFLIRFVSWFLSGFSPVPVPEVGRFDHRFGFDNIVVKLSHRYIKVILWVCLCKRKTYFYHSKSGGLHSRKRVFLYPNITKASKRKHLKSSILQALTSEIHDFGCYEDLLAASIACEFVQARLTNRYTR